MAARNSVKVYQENTFYHLYNRGVEKRKIFLDKQDLAVFLSYLQTYLSPKDETNLVKRLTTPDLSSKEKAKILSEIQMKNYADQIDLLSYVLMPNHFHLLIRQSLIVINAFMNSLGTRYGMYFNRKYKREGRLFQGVYRAVMINSEEQLLHLSRYIHLNPNKYKPDKILGIFPSSLPEYLGERYTDWVKPDLILSYFSKTNPRFSYADFMNQGRDDGFISKLLLD